MTAHPIGAGPPATGRLDWQTLARVSMDPTAVRILDRGACAPNEQFSARTLAAELDEPLGPVAYYVRKLARQGLLERAGTPSLRSEGEHYYRIAAKALG